MPFCLRSMSEWALKWGVWVVRYYFTSLMVAEVALFFQAFVMRNVHHMIWHRKMLVVHLFHNNWFPNDVSVTKWPPTYLKLKVYPHSKSINCTRNGSELCRTPGCHITKDNVEKACICKHTPITTRAAFASIRLLQILSWNGSVLNYILHLYPESSWRRRIFNANRFHFGCN